MAAVMGRCFTLLHHYFYIITSIYFHKNTLKIANAGGQRVRTEHAHLVRCSCLLSHDTQSYVAAYLARSQITVKVFQPH